MALTTFRGLKQAFGVAAIAASLSLSIIGGTTTTAHAQTISTAVTKPLAIKLGVFVPSEPEARSASSDVIFSGEIEYTIQNLVEQNSSYSVFSAGLIQRDDLRIIPVTIGQNWTDGKANYFYGFGVGVYNIKLDRAGITSGNEKWLFGFYGTLGMNFTKQFFGEIKYHYPYKYENQFVGGLQIMGGLRF